MLTNVRYVQIYKLIHVLVVSMYVNNKILFYVCNFYVLCVHIR